MEGDIQPPSDIRPFIQFEHTNKPDCAGCRKPDKYAQSESRLRYAIKQLAEENQRLLATCKHQVTRLIEVDKVVENELGVALEAEDVEQCLSCFRLLWERI